MMMVNIALTALLSLIEVSGEKGAFADDNKIINGEAAEAGEFPYMVSVQTLYIHVCGGSLIHSSVVLTACHCLVPNPDSTSGGRIESRSPEDYTVVAGVVNLVKTTFSSFRRLAVNAVEPHPKCERPDTGWNWDFGLMQLKGSFSMITNRIATIAVPNFPKLPGIIEKLTELQVSCTGAGWGFTKETGKAPLQLMKIDLKLVPMETCEKTLRMYAEDVESDLRFKPEAQVCTLGENGKDACRGDSGGPLICDTAQYNNETSGKTRKLIAIVSWGIGCGRPDVPGGWARLDVVYDWLLQRADVLQRSAPSSKGYGILKKGVLLNLSLTAVINAYVINSYSLL